MLVLNRKQDHVMLWCDVTMIGHNRRGEKGEKSKTGKQQVAHRVDTVNISPQTGEGVLRGWKEGLKDTI